MPDRQSDSNRKGRRLALVIAGTGVFYVLAGLLAAEYGWSMRLRGLFDLIALTGFGVALILAIGLWRARKDPD